MSEENNNVVATIPVTEGSVTISLAEYRALIRRDAVAEMEIAAKDAEVAAKENERSAEWWKAYQAAEEIKKRDAHIDELREQIAELKKAGRLVCDFLDSKPYLRSEYNLFQHERDLERAAGATKSEAEHESSTD